MHYTLNDAGPIFFRLSISYPELTEMQILAMFEAAINHAVQVFPGIINRT